MTQRPNIVEVGRHVLKELQRFAKHACIAGGWARDQLLGREPADVDVYLYTPDYQDVRRHVLDKLLGKETLNGMARFGYSKFGFGVMKFDLPSSVKLDVIILKDQPGVNVIQRFDLNICRAAFDGQHWHYTELFLRDAKHKEITFNFTPWALANMGKVTRRAKALSKKLGWPVRYTEPDNVVMQDASDPRFLAL